MTFVLDQALVVIPIIVVVLFLASALKVMREYERAVVFLLGRLWKVKGPGLVIIIPVIAWWGDAFTAPVFPESTALIRDMAPGQLWTRYVRYIGAGAVATAGVITLIRSIPVMVQSFRIGTRHLRERVGSAESAVDSGPERTDRDLPLKFVGYALFGVALVMTLVPQVFGNVGEIGRAHV